jgi:hypothetical protein
MYAYLKAAGRKSEKRSPLFRTTRGRSGSLGERAMSRNDALRMTKRRAKAAGSPLRSRATPSARLASPRILRTAARSRMRRRSPP